MFSRSVQHNSNICIQFPDFPTPKVLDQTTLRRLENTIGVENKKVITVRDIVCRFDDTTVDISTSCRLPPKRGGKNPILFLSGKLYKTGSWGGRSRRIWFYSFSAIFALPSRWRRITLMEYGHRLIYAAIKWI